jgi:hypothetical protein
LDWFDILMVAGGHRMIALDAFARRAAVGA